MKKLLILFFSLSLAGCENSLVDKNQSVPKLTDIDWRYVGASNHCMDWSPDMSKVDFVNGPSLRFSSDSTLSGKAHVNRYGGRYTATKDAEQPQPMTLSGQLSIRQMFMTEIGGPKELMEEESFMLQSLNNAFRYSVQTYDPQYDFLSVDYADRNSTSPCGTYLYFARKK
ncbi:MAG: META domain-containing protein [Cytophagales bacterium]|nr:META domain-containing protein [Cytophagales bacterium]